MPDFIARTGQGQIQVSILGYPEATPKLKCLVTDVEVVTMDPVQRRQARDRQRKRFAASKKRDGSDAPTRRVPCPTPRCYRPYESHHPPTSLD